MSSLSQKNIGVLLADDDADDRLLFEEAMLEVNSDAKLSTVRNGDQLMGYLHESTPPAPDMIFLDLNMPQKNGFECLEEIKKNDRYKNIPVVIFSTSSQQDAVDKVYRNGADYYICKPDSFQKLKKLLTTIFSLDLSSLKTRPTREEFMLSI